LRNIQNLNSVALIPSDLIIGLVAADSAVAHDLRLRERLLDMPMEEFPGSPMLGKRPADPQKDTKRTYPTGGKPETAATLCPAESATASPSERGPSEMCSSGIHHRSARTQHQRHQSWRGARVSQSSVRSGDLVVVPVGCQVLVSG
jgi:hypothetical protein